MTEERIENVPVGVDAIKAVSSTTPAASSNLIQQIYLCTVVDADGRERVLSTITSRGMMPMMSVDEQEREALEKAAQEIANTSGSKVRIIRLTGSEVVRVIERQMVQDAGVRGSGLLGPDGKPLRSSIDIRGIAGGGSTVDAAQRGMLGVVKKDEVGEGGGSGGKIGGGAKIGG